MVSGVGEEELRGGVNTAELGLESQRGKNMYV